jgi:hypothetical protein
MKNLNLTRLDRCCVYKDLRLGWDLLKGGSLSTNRHHGRTCLISVRTLLK